METSPLPMKAAKLQAFCLWAERVLIMPHLLKDRMLKIWNNPTCLERRPKMITFRYGDRFLGIILYWWISNIYKRYENNRSLSLSDGTTNITATEILYQLVFPSPHHHSHYIMAIYYPSQWLKSERLNDILTLVDGILKWWLVKLTLSDRSSTPKSRYNTHSVGVTVVHLFETDVL